MTSQVVLINKLGVAIASDSAVTSSRGKVLSSAEKIFELPPPHKIALLTSGVATFMEHPWEVVFSAWSETIDKPFPSITEYGQSLNKFLRTVLASGPTLSLQEEHYIWPIAESVKDEVTRIYSDVLVPHFQEILDDAEYDKFASDNWDEDFRQRMSALVTDAETQLISSRLVQLMNNRKERPKALNISDSQALVWVEDFWRSVETDFDATYLKSWPYIPELLPWTNLLISTAILHPIPDDASEICIVGYGDGDLFPSVNFFTIHGCLGGSLIKTHQDAWPPSTYAQRLFFGQIDAIMTLFSGDDYLLTTTAVNEQRKFLGSVVEQLSASSDESALAVRKYVEQSLESNSLAEEIRKVGREQRSQPFYRAIGMAPILDLAEFASQLVGVQAAYASMNQDNPTVGGFIDVAVITHRNGFEWIRHKA